MREKVTVMKQEDFINVETGETVRMDIVKTYDYKKDTDFHKIFLKNFIPVLEAVGGRKEKVLCWILGHLSRNNECRYTYRQIADASGASYATVAETMKMLQDADFLRKNGAGTYIVNPETIFWGSYKNRCIAIGKYEEAGRKDGMESAEKRLCDINRGIARLEREAKRIHREITEARMDGRA